MLLGMTDANEARSGVPVCHVHDATAVAAVLARSCCAGSGAAVRVECAGSSPGARWWSTRSRPHRLAGTVDIALDLREDAVRAALLADWRQSHDRGTLLPARRPRRVGAHRRDVPRRRAAGR